MIRALLPLLLTAFVFLLFGGSASAAKLDAPWIGGGPGSLTNVQNGASGDPRLDYTLNGPSGTWTYGTFAGTSRSVPVTYESTGFYSWYQVTTKLERFIRRGNVEILTETLAAAGPVNCCSAPSGGFGYKGTTTFDVQAGDAYGFRMSGANNTGSPLMSGTIKLQEVDATAPRVTHEVTGTKAEGDYYTGPVAVKFDVVEDESRISARTGCDATTVTEDTAGRTITCSVTSRGGTTTDSVTVKHDETAPDLAVPTVIVKQADAADGTTVTYEATATDGVDASPVVECSPASGSRFALGTTKVSCTARDAAGHTTTKTFDAVVFPSSAPGPTVNPSPGATAPAALKPINAVLAFRFTIAKATTRLVALKVKNLPKGATVTVTCKGSSCPKKLKGGGSILTSKGSTLSLSTLVKANLKGGTTINIAISASGAVTTIKSLAVRKGKAPVVNTCTASGAAPVAC